MQLNNSLIETFSLGLDAADIRSLLQEEFRQIVTAKSTQLAASQAMMEKFAETFKNIDNSLVILLNTIAMRYPDREFKKLRIG